MLDLVNARVAEVQKQLARFGFKPFDIQTGTNILKPGIAGLANYRENRITISSCYLREHQKETLERTVAHEVCHLYVHKYYPFHKQHHGPEFRRLMQALGQSGDTYHQMKLTNGPVRRVKTKTRYVYMTATGRECFLTPKQHEKARSGVVFRHAKTYEIIKYTGKVETFK
jgi:predicted SprT family Zn-dependent metalloprotease